MVTVAAEIMGLEEVVFFFNPQYTSQLKHDASVKLVNKSTRENYSSAKPDFPLYNSSNWPRD